MNEAVKDCNFSHNFDLAKMSKFISREFDDTGVAFKSGKTEMASEMRFLLLIFRHVVKDLQNDFNCDARIDALGNFGFRF